MESIEGTFALTVEEELSLRERLKTRVKYLAFFCLFLLVLVLFGLGGMQEKAGASARLIIIVCLSLIALLIVLYLLIKFVWPLQKDIKAGIKWRISGLVTAKRIEEIRRQKPIGPIDDIRYFVTIKDREWKVTKSVYTKAEECTEITFEILPNCGEVLPGPHG